MKISQAIRFINQNGILLVFPINNKKELPSLWSKFYPRSKMDWNWDSDGDDRVMKLWSLMKQLSSSAQVVYSKWYQGRATFFSKELFEALLVLQKNKAAIHLSSISQNILEILENDSPLSTKQLKKRAELQGKDNQKHYDQAMKQLFKNLQIVAFGEFDDGAFPSLAVGATKNLFEDLWWSSEKMDLASAEQTVMRSMKPYPLFLKYLEKSI